MCVISFVCECVDVCSRGNGTKVDVKLHITCHSTYFFTFCEQFDWGARSLKRHFLYKYPISDVPIWCKWYYGSNLWESAANVVNIDNVVNPQNRIACYELKIHVSKPDKTGLRQCKCCNNALTCNSIEIDCYFYYCCYCAICALLNAFYWEGAFSLILLLLFLRHNNLLQLTKMLYMSCEVNFLPSLSSPL